MNSRGRFQFNPRKSSACFVVLSCSQPGHTSSTCMPDRTIVRDDFSSVRVFLADILSVLSQSRLAEGGDSVKNLNKGGNPSDPPGVTTRNFWLCVSFLCSFQVKISEI